MADKNNKDSLSRNLKTKGIVIPVLFAVIVVLICMLFAGSGSFLPSGTHNDALTTTATTEKTEFDENEYSRIVQD